MYLARAIVPSAQEGGHDEELPSGLQIIELTTSLMLLGVGVHQTTLLNINSYVCVVSLRFWSGSFTDLRQLLCPMPRCQSDQSTPFLDAAGSASYSSKLLRILKDLSGKTLAH